MTLPPTCLIFSPHLDDAVFSCAGWIQQRVAEGCRVVVATVFSEGAPEHAVRRAEDAVALAYLGAEPLWLGFLDAPWRDPFYTGFEQLILGRSPGDDTAFVGAIRRSLQAVVNELQPAQLLAPLGVGTHVDHRLVFEAARQLGPPSECQYRFYEERPYCYAKGMSQLRLRQLGYATEPCDISRMIGYFRKLPHVMRYLPPGQQGEHCIRLMLEQASHRDAFRAVKRFRWGLSEQERIRARKAAAMYASQFTDFCGSEEELVAWDRVHADHLLPGEQRVEQCWTLFFY